MNPPAGKAAQHTKDKKHDAPIPPEPVAGATVKLSDTGTVVLASCTGYDPNSQINAQINSTVNPGNPNPTNEGEGVALYSTTDSSGNYQFHVSKAFLLPDLPRHVTVKAWDANHADSDEMDFS